VGAEDGTKNRGRSVADHEPRKCGVDLAPPMRQSERNQMHALPAEWSTSSKAARGLAAQPKGTISYPAERCGTALAEISIATCVIVFLMVD
jgi:hypothetical protein